MTTRIAGAMVAVAATVAAAGTGGYVALRQNASETRPAGEIAATVASGPELARAMPDPAPLPPSQPAAEAARHASGLPAPRPTPPGPVLQPKPVPAAPPPAQTDPVSSPTAPPPVEPPVSEPPPVALPPTPPPVQAARPPARVFDEVTVAAGSVIGIRLDHPLSSATARVEDKVTARVSRDVSVDERVALPAGARLEGVVTEVERGGKIRERARLGIRFHTLVLGESTRIAIRTEVIVREGESPTGEAASKVGASAVIGAILGGVIGGGKGAAIGTAAGAAGGTAAVMTGDRNDATLASGAALTVRLAAPITILIERSPH